MAAFTSRPESQPHAAGDPLQQIVTLLRDVANTISERTLRRVLAFATDPAGVAAHALAEDVRARVGPAGSL